MTKHDIAIAAARTALHRLPLVVLIALGVCIALCGITLLVRQLQKQRGVGAVASPIAPAAAYGDEPAPSGRFTTDIDYTSLAAPGDGEVTSSVAWNDEWFLADPTVYNHELATTASIVAALAYSESGYYQVANTQPAYMENALSKLGFTDISTASYQYRSEIVDEVLNLFTDESDTVAYAIARKHLRTADGSPHDLILVSIRGSYGSEWLSNLNLMPGESSASQDASRAQDDSTGGAQPFADMLTAWMAFVDSLAGRPVAASHDSATSSQLDGTDDHSGYFRAAEEIGAELARWVNASCKDGAHVSVLLTGHSRGGAIANLLAAEFDDALVSAQLAESDAAFSRVSAVYAYTFASPSTTVSDRAHTNRYANIFNIVNPSDIMPYLPLRAWGYERYGVNLYLPSVGDEGFDAEYGKMCRSYAQTVGVKSGCDPADKRAIDRVVDDVSKQIATVQDLMTPAGVAATVASCVTHINPVRILHGHYPSTYIAWMDALEAEDLTHE